MGNELQLNSPIEDKELSKDDIITLLSEDDKDEGVQKEEKEEKEDKEDEGEEEIELEEEDKEEEKEELVKEESRSLKDVTKDYPDLFKKHAFLKNSYYRERQFSEVFSDPQDAKDAQEKLEEYEELDGSIARGDTTPILEQVKKNNPRAFNKMVDSYLETLEKIDPDAHNHVLSGVIKNLITSLVGEAKRTSNEELRKVALAINRFAFDSDQFVPHEPLAKKGKGEEEDIDSEKEEWNRERFISTRDDLDEQVTTTMQNTIMKHIDPKGQMTDYVKKTAVRDALEETLGLLAQDKSLRKQLDSLWKRVFDSNFNSASKNAVRQAFLARAQAVLPHAIKKARTEALRGLERRERKEKEEPVRRRESTPSKNRGEKNKVPEGMSTLDFLSSD